MPLATGCRLALVVGLSGAAALPAPSAAQNLALTYEVYVGGLLADHVEVTAELNPDEYRMQSDSRTLGIIDLLVDFSSRAETVGALRQRDVIPARHRADNRWRGSERSVRIVYAAGSPHQVAADPAAQEDNRDAVPLAAAAHTLDPLSAAYRVVRELAERQVCTLTLPVFDGRRRYDLRFSDAGTAALDGPVYRGPAVRCHAELDRLAGFSRSQWLPSSDDPEVAEIWFARLSPEAPPIPVRLEAETTFAPVRVHLVAAALDGKVLLGAAE